MKKIYIILLTIAGILVGCGGESVSNSLISEENVVIPETEPSVTDISNEVMSVNEMSVEEENSSETSEQSIYNEEESNIWDAWEFTKAHSLRREDCRFFPFHPRPSLRELRQHQPLSGTLGYGVHTTSRIRRWRNLVR